MKTKLIALVTATAIASTGLSAPTQASEADNIARFIVGAAIIGALVNSANQPARAQVTSRPTATVHVRPAGVRYSVRYRPARPNTCLYKKWTRYGWKSFYGRKCMTRLGWQLDNRGWYKVRYVYR